MRTTVTIEDRLLQQAKLAATRSGRTLSDLVCDGLRLLLDQAGLQDVERLSLPVFGGSGLLRGADLEHKEGLASLLEDERTPRPAG